MEYRQSALQRSENIRKGLTVCFVEVPRKSIDGEAFRGCVDNITNLTCRTYADGVCKINLIAAKIGEDKAPAKKAAAAPPAKKAPAVKKVVAKR